MKLILKRIFKGPQYTVGKLSIDGIFECDVLEDTDRGLNSSMSLSDIKTKKVYGETAIPTGTYKVNMNTVSPKFKSRAWAIPYGGILPRLENVPGYEGVLIHVGNKVEDTLGCLLVGENKVKGQVINSSLTFSRLMNKLTQAHRKNEEITITIE